MWFAGPSDLVYIANKSGPDTAASRKQGLDKEPSHVIWKVRFVRYDVNQFRVSNAKFSHSGEEDFVVDCVKWS